jgi:uncharacterized iron-regulated protein
MQRWLGFVPVARLFAFCSVLLLVAVVMAPAAGARVPECGSAPGPTGPEHPLACRAFATDGAEVDWSELVERLAAAPLVLLGEVHDNADHHQVRAQLILALAAQWAQQPRAALVLEHIGADQDLMLAAFRALDLRKRRDPSELFSALRWEKSGWPDARLFRSLFTAALDVEWPILPGNAPRQQVRAVARDGLGVLERDDIERLGLGEALPEPEQSALLDELEASHCGLMPRSAFGGMADAQRYRDAHMARVLADAAAAHGRAVLLAGNGHVRRDRGVPWHLRRIAPDKRAVSVLHLEVTDEKQAPREYVERGADGLPTADYVILAPRTVRADPCVEMRKRFGR